MAICRKRYPCGPVEVELATPGAAWHRRLEGVLTLYGVSWPERPLEVRIDVSPAGRRVRQPAGGNYLRCARFDVDKTAHGYFASSMLGAWSEIDANSLRTAIFAPRSPDDELMLDELEQFLTLAVTLGWRKLGWTPLHAGSIVKGDACALLCATSGGGKSTLVASLIRRGWRTLGDDKLLLRLDSAGAPHVAALTRHFNLHPRTARWFPEVGDLASLPAYSRWTEKRQVAIDEVWPERIQTGARPTHLIQVCRDRRVAGARLEPLDAEGLLAILLKQVVIPRDRGLARRVLHTVASLAGRLRGLRLLIGDDAYSIPDILAPLEREVA